MRRDDDGDDPRARERCHLRGVRDAAPVAVTRDRDTCPVHPGPERVETHDTFGAVCPKCETGGTDR
ncbi:hypothetical protein DP107_12185 [Haloglomus irregulare]|uniref:Uncharacterized protein n=1 Tax=Haloglomus irregulare TaxID=2234134 RepID=A0A554N836_9EURY|nr:hypothetical protein DP107_12185 [Haloglomus irregulare]